MVDIREVATDLRSVLGDNFTVSSLNIAGKVEGVTVTSCDGWRVVGILDCTSHAHEQLTHLVRYIDRFPRKRQAG